MITATGVPEGYDALVLSQQAKERVLLHVCRDDARMAVLSAAIRFFDPNLTIIEFPAWDSLPYDRVSPNTELIVDLLSQLLVQFYSVYRLRNYFTMAH
jgi:transcription-repair coupling factor (superfamily II helicase)